MENEPVTLEELIRQKLANQQLKLNAMSTGTNLISFKGGQLTIDGSPVPNGEAEVIVLAQQYERAFYAGLFDGSKPQVPTCYSFDGETPHGQADYPQNEVCLECEHNMWGSAKQGRGKACRESARVALLPAGAPLDVAPLYQASFPITSIKNVQGFFARCNASGKLAGQFKTRLKVEPDVKTIFKASLTPLSTIENIDMSILIMRITQAETQLVVPYPSLNEDAPGDSTRF